jgi:hypothetical protein
MIRDALSPTNNNSLLPWLGDPHETDYITGHDQICRMCKEKAHTDPHILFECTAHPKVAELRQIYLVDKVARHYPDLHSLLQRQAFDEFLDEIGDRRGAIRRIISLVVMKINEIYDQLPECSGHVLMDEENPASVLFVIKQHVVGYSQMIIT